MRKRLLIITVLCSLHLLLIATSFAGRHMIDAGGRVPAEAGQTRSTNYAEFSFTVAGERARLTSVRLNLDMVHSWVEDLEVVLESPDGTHLLLFDRETGGPPQFDNFDDTYFTDGAGTAIWDGVAPYNGQFRPRNPFCAINGINPNGIWKLRIFDHYVGDYGFVYRAGDGRFEQDAPAMGWRGPLSGTYLDIESRDTFPLTSESAVVYANGMSANYLFTLGGTCAAPTLTATYTYLISGKLASGATLFDRHTSVRLDLCEQTSFNALSVDIEFITGFPRLYVKVLGATTDGGGNSVPNRNDVLFAGDYDIFDVQMNDSPIVTYYGGAASFSSMSTFSLGSTVTLPAGTYFLVVYGEDVCSPLESYVALAAGAPGGNGALHYAARSTLPAGTWQLWRFNAAAFPMNQTMNFELPGRWSDPFGNPADTSPLKWRTYHAPQNYKVKAWLRDTNAASGNVSGTAMFADWRGSPTGTVATTVEVLFYKPGTNRRVARFSMPAGNANSVPFNTPNVKAGTYDVVICPVYSPSTFFFNCEFDAFTITNLSLEGPFSWLGKRFNNVILCGNVDLGNVMLTNGDVNGDGIVNDDDLLAVLFAFGESGGEADLNGDGSVNDEDLLLVLFAFGMVSEFGDEGC